MAFKPDASLQYVNYLVIIVTFILFAISAIIKGWAHDLLLEVAVFLVSVKLIFATYKIHVVSETINDKLEEINLKLDCMQESLESDEE